jgi:site-specific DNA-methyltransferase (adenine-specific)
MEPFKSTPEGNFKLYLGDSTSICTAGFVLADLIFADPPYLLSNDGITCSGGKMVSVNKGEWDRSHGLENDLAKIEAWLAACLAVLYQSGTIWVSGTQHVIFKIGYTMEKLGLEIINDIIWYKSNAPPNLACKTFTHSHETLLWAKRRGAKVLFNYDLMKRWNDPEDTLKAPDKQMRTVWRSSLTPPAEKLEGKHPTQKPLWLLARIIAAASRPGDLVLDPFNGSGTTGIAAAQLGRRYVGIDTDPECLELTWRRYLKRKETRIYSPPDCAVY